MATVNRACAASRAGGLPSGERVRGEEAAREDCARDDSDVLGECVATE